MTNLARYFLIFLTTVLAFIFNASAATISNSGDEIEYEFNVTFKTQQTVALNKIETINEAVFHSTHVDGLFHSPKYAEKFDVITDLSEGFGGSKYPEVIEATSELRPDGSVWVNYTAKAKALVLKQVLDGWIGEKSEGEVQLPMPTDMTKVYSPDLESYVSSGLKKCTDEHYQEPMDFYYFYDPFTKCPQLGKEPIGGLVTFKIKRLSNSWAREFAVVPKEALKGDNGNGKLVTLYFANGFDDVAAGATMSQIKKDEGWKTFANLEAFLLANSYIRATGIAHLREMLGPEMLGTEKGKLDLLTPVTMNHDTKDTTPQRRFFSTFVKSVGDVTYVVRAGLFPTENEETSSPLVSFPKFWKEAWENGDFIYYGGHSGSGHHLSLDVMLRNLKANDLNAIRFQKDKTQIAYLDSCSSYAHFVDTYNQKKPKNLSIISYGLVSLFHLARASVETAINLVTVDSGETKWLTAIQQIEQAQLRPHIEFMWEAPDVEETYKDFNESEIYPALLLNVWVAD